MITEDYVSFEIAKLLKEKGFSEKTASFYKGDGTFCSRIGNVYQPFDWNHDKFVFYSAPTLQMAMKWLREIHNIHVVPKFDFYAGDYTGRIYDGRRESTAEKDDYTAIVGNSTYEKAAEAAIKYCLEKLI